MTKANWQGDTKKIYDVVKTLAGKNERPPSNLVTDGQGNMLTSAADVAARWYQFLHDKFAATVVEQGRPPMPQLPPTQGQNELSEKEIIAGLAKMQCKKACGPGSIPVEVYKVCPICKDLLIHI